MSAPRIKRAPKVAALVKADIQTFLHGSLEGLEDETLPKPTDLAFTAGRLVQCTLPHSDPGNVPRWERSNGVVRLSIQPYFIHPEMPRGRRAMKLPFPPSTAMYPYGTIPRLLMFWVVTEAVRTKNRRLPIGQNISDFMRSIGLDPRHGGQRSVREAVKDQIPRLFRSRISVEQVGLESQRWMDMAVAPEGDLSLWEPEKTDDLGEWVGYVHLGERFFEHICIGPQPLSLLSLRELKGSCLALDMYAYLTNRSYKAYREDKPFHVAWSLLAASLGSGYSEERSFRTAVVRELARVQMVCPTLRITHDTKELIIYPSQPQIASR